MVKLAKLSRKQHYLLLALIALLGVMGVSVAALNQEPQGIVETFMVKTAGSPLAAEPPGAKLPGTALANLGQKHIPETETVKYNSNPPTSGPHYAQWAEWGIYNDSPVDEKLVHNLEHGGIIVSYNPQRIQGQALKRLRSQVRQLSTINPRIILTPRPSLETMDCQGSTCAIALTAWTYLQKLNAYDPVAIKAFYDAHIARGPECQNGLCPL
jgi:hypothetical protein